MKFFMSFLFFVCSFASAVDCHYQKLTAIQAQSGNVLIQVKSSSGIYWKNLGGHSSASIKSYQSIAQQALVSGNAVMLRFTDDEGCSATNYGAVPVAFRMYD